MLSVLPEVSFSCQNMQGSYGIPRQKHVMGPQPYCMHTCVVCFHRHLTVAVEVIVSAAVISEA